MHKPIFEIGLRAPSYALLASLCASVVAAQAAPAPATPAPAVSQPAKSSSAPAAPPAAAGTPAPPAAAQPVPPRAAPVTPAPITPAPAPAPAVAQPSAPPPAVAGPSPPDALPPDALPPPRYGRLGGQPEPEIEKGGWDPWAHAIPGRFAHEGFFLRLNLGASFTGVSRPDDKWSGGGLGMGLAVGGSVVENFSLHADFQNTWLPSPSERRGGTKHDLDYDIVLQSMGVGATYYFMPVNIYVSASIGLGALVFEDDGGQSKRTKAGLALNGLVGKEWWVGSDWGLGIAAQLLFMRVKDYVDDEPMNALAFNLLFSATYN